ncbi:hypothetical protein VCHC46A1_2282 [Vibrio cholerae HC-46A1]|nr:hypothetical protein O3Y_15263 [Vibrio cholerae IEC224]APF58335.1 hypothetical protein ASZ81_03245 [Vibrio cholerae]EHH94858.1 hypothetical protein VCHC33A2_2913 [Vibrio cholerae HC-33A2]EJH55676.1 hypothetical protein VCHC46A1_2282 [Vibrio cholerae HC-46A1]KKP07923.1 hypothetical protein VP96_03801 [Vibrio cholerae]
MEHPTKWKHRGLLAYGGFETAEISIRSTKSTSGKTQKLNCAT